MPDKELLELGFIDTSYIEEDNYFREFTLERENFKIEVSGISIVEIKFPITGWITVPNCKNIQDLKELIRLFSLPLQKQALVKIRLVKNK